MTIKLIHKKKPEIFPNPDWIIDIKNVKSCNDEIKFEACVKYRKLNKRGDWFTAKYNLGHLNLRSNNCMWEEKIKPNISDPKIIISEALKIPILASVMYNRGCSIATQYEQMNDFFGQTVW